MASSEVDMKFLGTFAANKYQDQPFLSNHLFQVFGNLVMLADKVIRARKLRRLDTTRDTKSTDLYCRIIWYAREGLWLLEHNILPLIQDYGELKVLTYKLRASYYHLYVLFHNNPRISLKAGQIRTPPGLKSPQERSDKQRNTKTRSPGSRRPSSIQSTHYSEGGPVGGHCGSSSPPREFAASFLIPAEDYRPLALMCFEQATQMAERHLWGSHPLRLSVKVEFAAFLYDCMHEKDSSRQLAKTTISEVYNAQEGMDDDMFEDAAELVSILGRMMKRGIGSEKSAPRAGSSSTRTTPPRPSVVHASTTSRSGMDNAI